MSLQYYGVFDSVTGNPKRFGTCDEIDVEAQASEPNEIAMVCPPETARTIQNAQRNYEAGARDKPFVSPFKGQILGDGIPIITPVQ